MKNRAVVLLVSVVLLVASLIAYEWVSPEEFPSVDSERTTFTVELPEQGLVGQWPDPAMLGPGWDVTTDGTTTTVKAHCEPPKTGFGCPIRFPRPSMKIRRSADAKAPPELERFMVADDGRELRYQVTKGEEIRMCTSTMNGVFTLDGTDYEVECSYTTENWCGSGGKWCIELLAGLEHS
jgi:hypothetical protein